MTKYIWCILGVVLVSWPTQIATNNLDDCVQNASYANDTVDLDIIDRIVHPTNGRITYNLYKSNSTALSWCAGYHTCRSMNQRLAVLDTKQLQEHIKGLNITDLTWIAGRRKDYGSSWTWVNGSLTDCGPTNDCNFSSPIREECGRVLLPLTSSSKMLTYGCALPYSYVCFIKHSNSTYTSDQSNPAINWDDAQNECVQRSGRLTTLQEVQHGNYEANFYFVGLRSSPWLWISPVVGTDDASRQPVLYSSWLNNTHGDGSCMALHSNGKWQDADCSSGVEHIICEETSAPSTTSEQSTETPGSSPTTEMADMKTIIIAVVVSVVVIVIIIIIVVVVVCRRKKPPKPTNNNPTGVSNPGLAEDDRYVEGGHAQNPPDSTAYRPAASAEYAEVGLKPNINFVPPNTGYALATAPKGPAPIAPEPAYALAGENRPVNVANARPNGDVYSEVRKPRDNKEATTLIENATYVPFDPNMKNPKEKPPRKPKPSALR